MNSRCLGKNDHVTFRTRNVVNSSNHRILNHILTKLIGTGSNYVLQGPIKIFLSTERIGRDRGLDLIDLINKQLTFKEFQILSVTTHHQLLCPRRRSDRPRCQTHTVNKGPTRTRSGGKETQNQENRHFTIISGVSQ